MTCRPQRRDHRAGPRPPAIAVGSIRVTLPVLFALLLSLAPAVGADAAADEGRVSIRLASGFEMQVLKFPARRERLLIWLPSKYGIRDGNLPFARTVQREGIDYWLVDLHESYMAPTGRYGYTEFEPAHIKELIDHAVAQGWHEIVLGGESRGAALATQAARLWQIDNPDGSALRGMLFFHPYLIDGEPEIGDEAGYLPVVRETNLPIYIFQPLLNTKYLHIQALAEALGTGGAQVYLHPIPGARGGYHTRDEAWLNEREVEERTRLGRRIRMAVDLLARLPTPRRAAAAAPAAAPKARAPGGDGALVALGARAAPALRLTDAGGRTVDLGDLGDEVVLVNFWASWCAPCVKEIASLSRLANTFEGRAFRLLAVNVGETPEQVEAFFADLDMDPGFDLLFDRDGEAARAWRVYAVPSSYLVDRHQRVRYGYRGALRWDGPRVIELVDGLLE